MASYTYTPTTWNNGGAPGISATNLQNIETGISNAATYKVDKDGSTVMTAALQISFALGGSNKTFLDLNATDKKHWQIGQDTGGDLYFWNATDSVNQLSLSPTGSLFRNGQTIWDSGNDGSGSGLDADLLDGHDSSYFMPQGGGTIGPLTVSGDCTVTGNTWEDGISILVTGHQEHGQIGIRARCETNGGVYGYYQTFRRVMQNTPSSVTLTNHGAISSVSSAVTNRQTQYGVVLEITSSIAGGATEWYGDYDTVGNCIIALDEAARTFDHHCDHRPSDDGPECGCIRRGLSLDTDLIVWHDPDFPDRYGIHTTPCPSCGGVEHFNIDLGSADERSQDFHPNFDDRLAVLAAQPFLIRRVQMLLGLPVLP